MAKQAGRLTEIFWQEDHTAEIHDSCPKLTQEHVAMPSGDLEGDHDELIDDQCGIRDSDDVEEFRLEEE